MVEPQNRGRKLNPREKASIFSYLSFIWTANIFIEDVKEKLNTNNLWKPYSKHRTEKVGEKLEREWKKELKKCSKSNKRPSLMLIAFKAFWFEFLLMATIHLINSLADVLVRPWLLKRILNYFTEKGAVSEYEFYEAGISMVLLAVLLKFLSTHYTFGSFTLGMLLRAACTSLIYKKSLRISPQTQRDLSSGHIVNLVSNDASRFETVVVNGNYLWTTPIVALIISYSIYTEVGVAGIPGFTVIVIVCILQGIGAKLTTVYRKRIAEKTDERIRITDEVITGIHVIKMYAWEQTFYNLLLKARKIELKEILKANIVRGIYMGFNLFTRRAAVCFTLITYVVLGQKISAPMVYLIITYFGLVAALLSGRVVRGIGDIAEARVSFRRIEDFLLSDEISDKTNTKTDEKEKNTGGLVISLKNVTASWSDSSSDHILEGINFDVRKEQITMIVGAVGSGKSSLLQLICGELKTIEGTIAINGTVSYCSQEPWIFGGTVKENILLGTPYNRDRYEEVVRVCCLERDLDLFVDGDLEMVGERGATLSGGQKARINLARAVYKDADIYLFDDPLSAVDTHVAKSIFQNCFQDFLKNKTVIVATHQLQFLKNVDHIILLKNGQIEDEGTFEDIIDVEHKYLKSHGECPTEEKAQPDIKEKVEPKKWPSLQRIVSCDDSISVVSVISESEEVVPVNRDSKYEYKGSPYLDYIKIGGSIILPLLFVFFFIAAQAFANISDYFLNIWINQEEASSNSEKQLGNIIDETFFISIYFSLVVGLFIAAFSRGFTFFSMAQRCSRKLHTAITKSVIFTDISFFNDNPTGAILNRFSRDLGSTDEMLPKVMLDTCQVFGQTIGTVILLFIINYILLIPFVILAVVSYLLRHFFMKTSLNLKHLEGACRSPIFTHLSSTLAGLATIRAYGSQEFLIQQFNFHQDLHTSAVYSFQVSLQSYTLLLDLLSIGYLCFVIFSFAIFYNDAPGADVGLAITQTVSATSMLQWGLTSASETTSLMTSVERILAFVGLQPEESGTKVKQIPPPMWPTNGRIDFNNVSLYYKENSPVLKKVTFTINPGEKVGIVGRTGAGKSSITQALFRFATIEGNVVIDGINTREIPLNILRSRIAIIPQNPILFSGDIRRNLDPYSDFPDYVLTKVLDELEIPDFLKENGLDTKIRDGGVNMSIGQRQLICLARAILRNTNIIILDEATANVDPNTDFLIQQIIKKKFTKCTVLTIAHRLNTIMDCDRIIVMDAGKLVEYDSPHLLLQKKKGYFLKLVNETGREMASDLIIQAQKNFWRKQQETLQD